MLSSVFKAIKCVYEPCSLEVITDQTLIDAFSNDPNIDILRLPRWWEKMLPKHFYKENNQNLFKRKKGLSFVIWPEYHEKIFSYLANGDNLEECISAPYKNILSYNYALQISEDLVKFPDLRPRIYLTENEIEEVKKTITANSIALNMARIRNSHKRYDGEPLRYKKEHWRAFVNEIKKYDPKITIYELGQDQFEGIGDKFIPKCNFRKLAAILNAMRLVVLSDGGIHNLCNAIDKKVLLFQAFEWSPPDLFKMHNAIFNENYHTACRKQCHLFSEILNVKNAVESCARECYDLDPKKLAKDCIIYLEEVGVKNSA